MSRERSISSGKNRRTHEADGQRKKLLVPTIILLLLGLACSIYLCQLHFQVSSAAGPPAQSFCAISEGLNCITVATSTYSSFLGIPIAVYGLEFFFLALVTVVLSATGIWNMRHWDSFLFDATAISLPGCGILAWISAVRIRSFCLVCTAIYAINLILFILLAFAGRKRLRSLVLDGPREVLKTLARPRWSIGLGFLGVLVLSQFFWFPKMIGGEANHAEAARLSSTKPWHGLPVAGLTIGPVNASLKVEEYTDFQCPHCGKAHDIMIEVLRRFPGKIHLIHRDFPLDMACNPMVSRPFHQQACQAATYARCASLQGKYWPLEELLFKNRDQLDENHLQTYGARVQLDPRWLAECVRSPRIRQAIRDDIQRGLARQVHGTPTLFVNGEKLEGMQPMAYWEERIKRLEKR